MTTPNGVKHANRKSKVAEKRSYPGNALFILIPKDIPAAPLWRTIAMAYIMTLSKSLSIPRESPSKTECTPKPIIKINGVMF